MGANNHDESGRTATRTALSGGTPCPPPPPGARVVLRGAVPFHDIARRAVAAAGLPPDIADVLDTATRSGDADAWDQAAEILRPAALAAGFSVVVWSAGGRVWGVAQGPGGGPPACACRPRSTHPLAVMLECIAAAHPPTS